MNQTENCLACRSARALHEQGVCKCSCHPRITCLTCSGNGYTSDSICPKCFGSGDVINLLSIKINLFA